MRMIFPSAVGGMISQNFLASDSGIPAWYARHIVSTESWPLIKTSRLMSLWMASQLEQNVCRIPCCGQVSNSGGLPVGGSMRPQFALAKFDDLARHNTAPRRKRSATLLHYPIGL